MTSPEMIEWIIDNFEGHEFVHRDPSEDPGGATKYGVSLRTYKRYHPAATPETIKNLTMQEAVDFMLRVYVYDPEFDLIQSDRLRLALIDFAIHSSPHRAGRYLQIVLGVAADGQVGPLTRAAVGASDTTRLANVLTGRRLDYLSGLRNWDANSEGWALRIAHLVEAIND